MKQTRSFVLLSAFVAAAAGACASTADPSVGTATSHEPGASSSSPPDHATGAPATGPSTGSGSEATAGSSSGTRDARLSFRLVDAPADDVTAVVVTVARVEASIAGVGWTKLVEKEATVDLLTLQGGTFLDLGTATLPPGRIEQLRLYLTPGGDHHVTTTDGTDHALVVPSGEESGIKLVGGFDVPACGRGHITLDFDGKKSLVNRPQGWLLKPVVRLKAIAMAGGCEEDGGAEASAPPPAVDACASVTCAETEICENGACR